MTSLRNKITYRWVAASEQVGDIKCFSFNVSAISLSVFVLIAPLLSNVLYRGAKEADNIRSTDRLKARGANTEWRNG